MPSQVIETQPKVYDFTVYNAAQDPSVIVSFRRTAIGWYNLYFPLLDKPFVNVGPDVFLRIFPDFTLKAKSGSGEVRVDDLSDIRLLATQRDRAYILWTATDFEEWHKSCASYCELPPEICDSIDYYYTVFKNFSEIREVV